MTIYIEYVIIDNLVFDCLLLYSAGKTLKIKVAWWRIFLGGVVGVLCAFGSVYLSGVLNILIKLVCLVLMSMVCVGVNKKLFWHILLTLAYTFVLGGAIVGIFYLFQIEFSLENVITYNNGVPLGVYVTAIVLFVFLIFSIVKYIKAKKKVQSFCTDVTLTVNNQNHNIVGFLDSGNTLMHNNIPVCFVVGDFKKKVSTEFATALLGGKTESISYQTMAGQDTTIAIEATIKIDDNTQEIYLAMPKNKQQTGYDILLNACLIKEENNETEHTVTDFRQTGT